MVHQKSSPAAAAGLALAMSACACAAGAPVADLQPLDATEIARRFSNVAVAGVAVGSNEVFGADGRYERQGRAVTYGRFTVGDGRICVSAPPRPTLCRRVLGDKFGNTYFAADEPGSTAPPAKVELTSYK